MKITTLSNVMRSATITMLFLAGCQQQDDLARQVNNSEDSIVYDKNNGVLSFGNREQLKECVRGELPVQRIVQFYEEGFKPNRLVGGLNEIEFNKAISVIGEEYVEDMRLRVQKSGFGAKGGSSVDYEEDEDELVRNGEFASLLNSDREIIVDDTIYKYTDKGVLFTSVKDINKLKQIDVSSISNLGEGVNSYEGINVYVPFRHRIDKYDVAPPVGIYPPDRNPGVPVGQPGVDYPGVPVGNPGGGVSVPDTNIPDNFDYVDCSPSNSFFDNIFGREYYCEYFFNSRRKLRTIFAVEDYYLFFDVYAQAKFKHKGRLGGWYSSREASTVFVKIDKAELRFKRRSLNINIGVRQQELVDFYNKILNRRDKVIHISNEFDANGTSKSFALSENDVPAYGEDVVTPSNISNEINSSFKYSNIFNNEVNKIVVINVLGRNVTVTDHDIYQVIYNYLKSKYGSTLDNTAVVIKKDNVDNKNNITSNIEYIDYAKNLVQVKRLAVARRTFQFPKEFELKSFYIDYMGNPQDPQSSGKLKVNINFGYNAVKGWDVSIKSGALYNGRWGGSVFSVKKS